MSGLVPYRVIQERILAVAFRDIVEPEYCRCEKDFSEFDENYVQPILSYFDRNDVLRKKEFCTHLAINKIELYSETGELEKKITIFQPGGQRENFSLKIFYVKENKDRIFEFSAHTESVVAEREAQY